MTAAKQNMTICLIRQTLQKVRLLAVRLAASIGFVGREEAAYQRARRQAMMLLDQGFHVGGVSRANRNQLLKR